MNRFDRVVRLPDERPDLEGIAERFLGAIKEARAEGEDPAIDAAVMLLGAHIAFHVHADVSTTTMYRQLIEQCAARMSTPETYQ